MGIEDTSNPSPLPDAVSVDELREALVSWYQADHRSFPWRDTTDPYEILVAEVMSQQTQLTRIETAWRDFLDTWPTVAGLAAADRSDVIAFWTNHRLGYNNRARYLHEAANEIMTRFDGSVPESPAVLEELTGVGPYTANAVASFAFNNGDAVVDTNVKRVLHRVFDIPDDEATFDAAASALLPAGQSRIWNNAIMELGGVACQKTPRCDAASCPLRSYCEAYHTGDFTAPDVQSQPSFEGSRRQFRGRIIRCLSSEDAMTLDNLGQRIRVDYAPDGEYGRAWLRDLLDDLAAEGLVSIEDAEDADVQVKLKE